MLRRELLIVLSVAAIAILGAAGLWIAKPHKPAGEVAAVVFQADASRPLRGEQAPAVQPPSSAATAFIPGAPVPIMAPSDAPVWQRNAVAAVDTGARPMIAIV